MTHPEQTNPDASAEKCYDAPSVPWGVLSFADYDTYREGEELRELTQVFNGIVSNIALSELSPAEKAAAVADAANELTRRMGEDRGERGIFAKALDIFRRKKGVEEPSPFGAGVTNAAGSAVSVFKDRDGNYRWLGIYSNTFWDREAERFSEEAHREFEDYCDRSKNYPELWLWHVPGSAIGSADLVAYDDKGFMLASGTFNEAGEALVPAIKSFDGVWGMSHGFKYLTEDLSDGVYQRYRSHELSLLPLGAAANLKTGFDLEGEMDMALREDKRKLFVRLGGEDFAKAIESRMEAFAKDADEDSLVVLKEMLEPPATKDDATPAKDPPAATQEPEQKDADPNPLAEQLAGIANSLKGIGDGMAALTARMDQQDEAIKELKRSEDEKLASVWGKAWNPAQARERAASTSKDTELHGNSGLVKEAKEQGDGIESGPVDAWYLKAMGGQPAALSD